MNKWDVQTENHLQYEVVADFGEDMGTRTVFETENFEKVKEFMQDVLNGKYVHVAPVMTDIQNAEKVTLVACTYDGYGNQIEEMTLYSISQNVKGRIEKLYNMLISNEIDFISFGFDKDSNVCMLRVASVDLNKDPAKAVVHFTKYSNYEKDKMTVKEVLFQGHTFYREVGKGTLASDVRPEKDEGEDEIPF